MASEETENGSENNLTITFKILNGYYNINPLQFFTPSDVTSTTERQLYEVI